MVRKGFIEKPMFKQKGIHYPSAFVLHEYPSLQCGLDYHQQISRIFFMTNFFSLWDHVFKKAHVYNCQPIMLFIYKFMQWFYNYSNEIFHLFLM